MKSSNNLQSLLHDLNINPQYLTLAIVACTVVLLAGAPMFESLLGYLWNQPQHESSSSSSSYDRRSRRKSNSSGAPRTRAEQLRLRGENGGGSGGEAAAGSSSAPHIDDVYYPGLVNISGTYCFLNSTLQALASLSYLQPQIESTRAKAEEWDVPTPVIDALRDTLNSLNTPHHRQKAFRPQDIIDALSRPDPKGNRSRSRLFSSREHQDAQELFQLVSSCLQEEGVDVDGEIARDHGLAEYQRGEQPRKESKNVFEGLTANRRSCVQCGYTEAVMHFSIDNVTLPVPRASQCKLEDCLAEYTRMETLDDCVCRKCSMLATLSELKEEADRLAAISAAKEESKSKRRKAEKARALQQAVQEALDNNRIEQEIPGVTLKKVQSPCSTKQAMIARPPPVLVLHLNRSAYYGYGHASKNSCAVIFPEILDLTPYTTSGQLSTIPSSPISSHANGSAKASSSPPRPPSTPILYRLAAIVCHYGSHGFGHFVTYRRKPRPSASSSHRSRTVAQLGHPRIAHSLTCTCSTCAMLGRIRDYEPPDPNDPNVAPERSNRGWLKISDDDVEEVGLKKVMSEVSGTFMLYYERVLVDSGRTRKASISRRTPPPELHVDTTSGTKMHPNIHVSMSATSSNPPASAAARSTRHPSQSQSQSQVYIPGVSSPRSSEETVTQDNVRQAEEDPGTPKAVSASQDLPPVDFPKSAMSRSSSTTSARIVRNVTLAPLPAHNNPTRSRTTSGASARSAASASPIVVAGPPLSSARSLVMETNPSPLPPGSARTRARFTPPATPLVLPTPINLVPDPRLDEQDADAREDSVVHEPEPELVEAEGDREPEPETERITFPEPMHFPKPIRFPEPELVQVDLEPEPGVIMLEPEMETAVNGSAEVGEEEKEEDSKEKKRKKKEKTSSSKSSKKTSKVNGSLRT